MEEMKINVSDEMRVEDDNQELQIADFAIERLANFFLPRFRKDMDHSKE